MRNRARMQPWVPLDVRRRTRAYCVTHDVTESALTAAALVQYMDASGVDEKLVLRRLDGLAAGLAAPYATCIYAIIDPAASTCLIAQAGHQPPVLVLPGGTTMVLDLPPGLPLGLGAESFETTRISLPRGATLALYTDGLVESRTRPLDDGLAALRDMLSTALAGPRSVLGDASETVTRALRQHGEDDITLVLARVRP